MTTNRATDNGTSLGGRIRSHLVPFFFLLCLCGCAFWSLPSHDFLTTWDDPAYITRNPAIRGLTLTNLRLAFSNYYVGNYAPVQIISYMLDYTLWGLRPAGFFCTNILCHLLSGWLLYLLLLRLGGSRFGATMGAALFLIHPVQVESVAWLSQRKNLLAMLFSLLSFHTWLTAKTGGKRYNPRWYGASLAFFVLALLAKSVAVILPLLLILAERLVSADDRTPRRLLHLLPFLAAALGVGALAIVSQSPGNSGGLAAYPEKAWLVLPMTMLPVLFDYLRLIILPLPSTLCAMYYPPLRHSPDVTVCLSLAGACGLAWFGLYLQRRSRPALFWYAAFFICLLPVAQIIPLVTLMNDRYLYFPMLGIAGLACHAADEIQRCRFKTFCGVAAFVLVAALTGLSRQRCDIWRDAVTLFSDTTAKLPNQAAPWNELGMAQLAAGNVAKAETSFLRSAAPGMLGDTSPALYNLALFYLDHGALPQAHDAIIRLITSGKKRDEARLLLAEYYFRSGNRTGAEQELQAYLALHPDSVEAQANLQRVQHEK